MAEKLYGGSSDNYGAPLASYYDRRLVRLRDGDVEGRATARLERRQVAAFARKRGISSQDPHAALAVVHEHDTHPKSEEAIQKRWGQAFEGLSAGGQENARKLLTTRPLLRTLPRRFQVWPIVQADQVPPTTFASSRRSRTTARSPQLPRRNSHGLWSSSEKHYTLPAGRRSFADSGVSAPQIVRPGTYGDGQSRDGTRAGAEHTTASTQRYNDPAARTYRQAQRGDPMQNNPGVMSKADKLTGKNSTHGKQPAPFDRGGNIAPSIPAVDLPVTKLAARRVVGYAPDGSGRFIDAKYSEWAGP